MKINAVTLAGVYTSISTRSNLIAKVNTNLVSVIGGTNKKSYM